MGMNQPSEAEPLFDAKRDRIAQEKKPWWKSIGPGLITGAADDDPSGIATYSQAGAKFGFNFLWSMLFCFPLMAAIQIIAARIGVVSGHGISTHVRHLYPRWVLFGIVTALCIANTINIGADIAAMGDATALLIGSGKSYWYALGFGVFSLTLQILIPYSRYVQILKWLTFVLFAYIATAFAQHIDWRKVIVHLFKPQWQWSADYITMLVALLGTTISPYLFFWQSSQEVEELRKRHLPPVARVHEPRKIAARFSEINVDTLVGMGVSNTVAFFIMLSTAVALHQHGVTHISTSAEAASALRPIAGNTAFLLFALGIIGTGLLAIPVLAGSCAYAVSGAFHWKASLEHEFSHARAFYSVIALAIALGIALCFAPINPIEALYWSAVINGVVAVPLMAIMMIMANDKRVMGDFRIGPALKFFGWLATGVMGFAAAAMFLF